jgi:hypothetical protein
MVVVGSGGMVVVCSVVGIVVVGIGSESIRGRLLLKNRTK